MPVKSYIQQVLSVFGLFCLSCSAAQAQIAAQGEKLFQKLNCAQCHSVAGKGGCLAPALDGVMKTRQAAYVKLRLNRDDESSFIKLIGHPELFPHPRFKKQEVAELIAYLSTVPVRNVSSSGAVLHHDLSKRISKTSPESAKEPQATEANGKTLFYNSGCLSCHSVAGLGGNRGPALDGVGRRHSRAAIESFLAFPLSVGAKEMPRATLTSIERQEVIEFLLSLPDATDTSK